MFLCLLLSLGWPLYRLLLPPTVCLVLSGHASAARALEAGQKREGHFRFGQYFKASVLFVGSATQGSCVSSEDTRHSAAVQHLFRSPG